MSVDFSSLERAASQLERSLAYCDSDLAHADPELALQFRSAAIQAFEYTYELGHKTIRRVLLETGASAATIDVTAFPDMIRIAAEKGLSRNGWKAWGAFRQARGATSHTYDEDTARRVFAEIPSFLDEIRFLLHALRERAR